MLSEVKWEINEAEQLERNTAEMKSSFFFFFSFRLGMVYNEDLGAPR